MIRDGYAPDVDVAYLQEEIPPAVFEKLAARLRELKAKKGNARMALVFHVGRGYLSAIDPDWGERYVNEKRRA